MLIGKRERREAKLHLQHMREIAARAEAVPHIPKNQRPHTSLEKPKLVTTRWRPAWDYKANEARSQAMKDKGRRYLP